MKKLIIIFAFVFAFFAFFAFCPFVLAQNCVENAKPTEPTLSAETRKIYETKLDEAKADFDKNPKNADAVIWLGRRTAYLGNYKEAIAIFTKGIENFPSDARIYRHRGHRFITLRCFDDAVRDFEKTAKLIKGKADEIEPDGLPNARNIPTSTLQSNIFYHLGLAFYLKGDFKKALKAYREAEKVSKNPDMLVATTHWLYMTLRRLGREKEANKSVAKIKAGLDIIESGDYYKLVKLYQGKLKAEDLLKEIGAETNTLSNASLGYGLGNWFLYNGEKEKASKIFRQITAGNQWASFGYIAAEADLSGIKIFTGKKTVKNNFVPV
jgi:tetratricopeptide (TPR) repeat protein